MDVEEFLTQKTQAMTLTTRVTRSEWEPEVSEAGPAASITFVLSDHLRVGAAIRDMQAR